MKNITEILATVKTVQNTLNEGFRAAAVQVGKETTPSGQLQAFKQGQDYATASGYLNQAIKKLEAMAEKP